MKFKEMKLESERMKERFELLGCAIDEDSGNLENYLGHLHDLKINWSGNDPNLAAAFRTMVTFGYVDEVITTEYSEGEVAPTETFRWGKTTCKFDNTKKNYEVISHKNLNQARKAFNG